MPSQEKRQRQKAGRQARLQAEQKARKRKQNIRRLITVVILAAIVVGLSYLIFKPSGSKSASTTTSVASSTTTRPAPAGGSGNTSPSAITTSADCPANFSATLNKPSSSTPPMTINPSKTYTATVTTDVGTFTLQLDAKTSPKATNSFVYLADHHFFDCIVFHRVIQTFMDQTGDPTGTGSGGPGYQFTEAGPSSASPQYPIGSVAMANADNPPTTHPTTNGSQFFIVTGSEGESLAPDYTLFGQVKSGMDVLQKINADGASATNSAGSPAKLHRMVSVTISVT